MTWIVISYAIGMVLAVVFVYVGYRMGRDTVVIEGRAVSTSFDPGPDIEVSGDYIGDELKDYDDPKQRIRVI